MARSVAYGQTASNDEIIMLHQWLQRQEIPAAGPLRDLRNLIDAICADGVVTSAERKALLAFLKGIAGALSPAEKGEAFEKYVITRFDKKAYRLIEWRSDKYIDDWGGPVSSQWPDLVMEHTASGDRFAIECKFRSKTSGPELQWAEPRQLRNYRAYEEREKVPVYIAIGLGGEPHWPDSLFILRLDRMKSSKIPLRYLEQFRFPAQATGLEFG